MLNKMLIAAMVIIAVLNFIAFISAGGTFSLVIAVSLIVLAVLYMFMLKRK